MFAYVYQVEGTKSLVSELSTIAAREKSMLDECRDLLASTATMQVSADKMMLMLQAQSYIIPLQNTPLVSPHVSFIDISHKK